MLRRFLGVALTTILLASSAAWAGSNLQRLGAPAPFWVLRSQGTPANVDFDFANGRYYQKNAVPGAGVSNLVTITRASTKYCENTSGLFGSVGNAVLCVTNKGALIEEARTNDALWARDMTNAAWVKTTMTHHLFRDAFPVYQT